MAVSPDYLMWRWEETNDLHGDRGEAASLRREAGHPHSLPVTRTHSAAGVAGHREHCGPLTNLRTGRMGATRDSWALRKPDHEMEGPLEPPVPPVQLLKKVRGSAHTAQLPPFQMGAGHRGEAEEGAEARIKALPKGPYKAGND